MEPPAAPSQGDEELALQLAEARRQLAELEAKAASGPPSAAEPAFTEVRVEEPLPEAVPEQVPTAQPPEPIWAEPVEPAASEPFEGYFPPEAVEPSEPTAAPAEEGGFFPTADELAELDRDWPPQPEPEPEPEPEPAPAPASTPIRGARPRFRAPAPATPTYFPDLEDEISHEPTYEAAPSLPVRGPELDPIDLDDPLPTACARARACPRS